VPVTDIPLDSSAREEDVTILHGKNLLLKLIEDKNAKQFLSQTELQKFLSTEDLCAKGFRETMNRMLEMERHIALRLEENVEEYLFITRRFSRREIPTERTISRRSLRQEPPEIVSRFRARVDATVREVQKLDKELPGLEDKIKEFNKELEVLDPIVLSRCPRCRMPVIRERKEERTPENVHITHRAFREERSQVLKGELKRPAKCKFCGNTVDRENVKRTHLHSVKENIRRLWESNLWLEDYSSRLLKSLDWQTWPHVHVLGSSGVRHEIDVLGVKGSYVLVCECKTGRVSRQDVFNFWAKVYDIRSHVGMLALIEELPEAETKEFVAKNPSVVLLEKLGEKGKKQIIDELRSGILGKI
jgi:hypothetical protein